MRTRTIEVPGDGGMGCPALNETRPCAEFHCGQVSTVAGGQFGWQDDGVTPDHSFAPQSLSVKVNGLNDDVIYVSGDRKTSSLLKRVEVKEGTVKGASDCPDGTIHHPSSSEFEGDKCVKQVANVGHLPGLTGLHSV